eukprot:1138987-Pelagomonas_calceolata.AAC.3
MREPDGDDDDDGKQMMMHLCDQSDGAPTVLPCVRVRAHTQDVDAFWGMVIERLWCSVIKSKRWLAMLKACAPPIGALAAMCERTCSLSDL